MPHREERPLSPTAVILGKYEHAYHHRDGLFSEVFKASSPHEPKDAIALKVTRPSLMVAPHDSEREARILQSVQANSIIPLLESFALSGGRFVLAFPFLPYDFAQLLGLKKVTAAQAASHLHNLLSALSHLHATGMIHRDVKPSNILLRNPDGPAYLSDFGIAWSPHDRASEPSDDKITDVGTTCYRPPELLFGWGGYGCELDLWATGCVVAEAASLMRSENGGETLFDAGEVGSELALIQSIFQKMGTPEADVWPVSLHAVIKRKIIPDAPRAFCCPLMIYIYTLVQNLLSRALWSV